MSDRLHSILHSAAHHVSGFLPHKMRPEMKELFATTWILSFVEASIGLFVPIYLFTQGYEVYQIMLFYAGIYTVYLILGPIGGTIVKKKGFEHCIIYASFFQVLYYIALFSIPSNHYFIFLAMVAFALQKLFFWPGYHSEFVYFGNQGEEGREIGVLKVVSSLIVILGPVFGGLVASIFGFNVLFVILSAMVLLSNIPLMRTKEKFRPSKFKYMSVFKRLFSKKERQYLPAYVGFMEEFVFAFVWPLFVFVVVGNLTEVGSLVSATILVSAIALLVIGRMTDKKDRKRVMQTGGILYAISWIAKIFVQLPIDVFVADFYARTTRPIVHIPIAADLYHRAEKKEMVLTILTFEMGLVITKALTAFALAALFYYYPDNWSLVFILAGLSALCYLVFARYIKAKKGRYAR